MATLFEEKDNKICLHLAEAAQWPLSVSWRHKGGPWKKENSQTLSSLHRGSSMATLFKVETARMMPGAEYTSNSLDMIV